MSDGFGPSVRHVAATLAEIGATRIELAATEIELERVRLARQGLALLVALFFFGVGLVFLGAALVLQLPEADRPFALLALGAACGVVGAIAVGWWLRLSASAEPLLSATLAELRKDGATIAAGVRG